MATRWAISGNHAMRNLPLVDLFDDLVGDAKDVGRHREGDRLRGLQVDHQLELGRLDDRKISGLLAFENAAHIDSGLPEIVDLIASIADEPAGIGVGAICGHAHDRIIGRQRGNLLAPCNEQ